MQLAVEQVASRKFAIQSSISVSHARLDGGFAQVLVLTSLATISAIITVALVHASGSGALTSALDRQVRGEAAAVSGIRRVIAAIEAPADDLETRILSSEHPLPFEFGETRVELQIDGEGGKINPVRSAPELLTGYIGTLPLSEDARRGLLAAIEDARELDDREAGLQAVHRYLLPIVPMAQLESDFGIWNQTGGVDPLYASERVLSAIPDLTAGGVAQVLQLRKSDPSAVRALSAHFATGRPIFSIVAVVRGSAGEMTSKRVPIEISSAGRVLVLEPHF
jgi:hypothetical protein